MKKLFIFFMITTLCVFFGATPAFAETIPPEETYAVESFVEETTAPVETEAPATEQQTDPVETETLQEDTTQETTEKAQEEKPEYSQSLPEVASSDIEIPSAIDQNIDDNEPALFWGFVAWICVGVGAAVIFAVLLTTKTKAYRSGGKKRYSTGDKISGKQRLLSDKYYNNKRK